MSSGVEFDEDQLKYAPRPNTPAGSYSMNQYGSPNTDPKMVQWLMKKGIVKSPAMAQAVLIGLVVVNIIITFIVIKFFL
jgi:hypothetical protein